MTLPSPNALIFDWDNTLVDTWPIIGEALNVAMRAMGKESWSPEKVRQNVRRSMRDSFPDLFGEGWEKAGEIYQQHYRAVHLDALKALPGAEEVLKKARDLDLCSVVVSNKKGAGLRLEVAHLGWEPYFDAIVGSDDAARDKPHADPVRMAFEKSGMAPGPDVWFIGDSEIDLECAKNTGCTAILFGEHAHDHPSYTATHYRDFLYHAHVRGHEEILALLDGLR